MCSVNGGMSGEVEFGGIVNDEDALVAGAHAFARVESVGFLQEVKLGALRMNDAIEAAEFVYVEPLRVGGSGLIGHACGSLDKTTIEAGIAEADPAQFLFDPIAIARGLCGLLGVHCRPDLGEFSIILE